MRPAKLFALCALSVSGNAFATSFDSLDLFYTSAELKQSGRLSADSGDLQYQSKIDDLEGFGAKFRGSIADDLFFAGEYQRATAERIEATLTDPDSGTSQSGETDIDLDYTEWRLGLGVPFYRAHPATFYGVLEYLNLETEAEGTAVDPGTGQASGARSESKQDGAGAHLGVLFNPMRNLSLYGQLGYLRLDDLDGIEYLLGAAAQVHRYGGLFVEYRDSDLDGDDDQKAELSP
ncbi:MAG: hypothetical protein ACREUF_16480, partial [Solimonas sp.]